MVLYSSRPYIVHHSLLPKVYLEATKQETVDANVPAFGADRQGRTGTRLTREQEQAEHSLARGAIKLV